MLISTSSETKGYSTKTENPKMTTFLNGHTASKAIISFRCNGIQIRDVQITGTNITNL